MPTFRLAHTYELEPALLARTRSMLEVVFDGELSEEDWEHCIGGVHSIAFDGDAPIGHAAVVQRQLIAGGRILRAGYVEGVGVRADWQRKGIAARMMADLERVIRGAYDLGALGATDDAVPLYLGRGWLQWKGPLSALTPQGLVATPDEAGGIYVLQGTVPLELNSALTCDWRGGDVW